MESFSKVSHSSQVAYPLQTEAKKTSARTTVEKTVVAARKALSQVRSEVKEFTHQLRQNLFPSIETREANAVGNRVLKTESKASQASEPVKTESKAPPAQDLFVRQLSRKMSEFFDSHQDPKNVAQLKTVVDRDLKKLFTEYPTLDKEYIPGPGVKPRYVTPEIKEKLMLLQSLKTKIETDPKGVAADMWSNAHEPTYKMLGAVQFLAIVAHVDKAVEQSGGEGKLSKQERNLSTLERVAVFAYTTGKYNDLNPALRKAKGEPIHEPGLADMAKHLDSALAKLSNFKVSKEVPVLKRAIKLPGGADDFVAAIFGKPEATDFAYYSTSLDSKVSSDVNVTIMPPLGAKAFPNAHEVPSFLTAWGGEKEVLFKAGTQFEVVSKEKTPDGKSWSITLRCLPDKSLEEEPGLRSRLRSWRQTQIFKGE